jgi:hypothetical protein
MSQAAETTETREAKHAPVSPALDAQRRAEMDAGRARLQELHDAAGIKDPDFKNRLKDSDETVKEDEARRHELLTFAPGSQAERDRAGAEVADQAQTELEAVLHFADRQEQIIAGEHQSQVERLDHRTVNIDKAEQTTTDAVTAQAVNQPVVLAHPDGYDTAKPLNPQDMEEHLIPDRLVRAPSERYAPRTREKAEKVSRHKVPRVEQVVKQGWHEGKGPDPDAAVKAVRAAKDPEALSTKPPELG